MTSFKSLLAGFCLLPLTSNLSVAETKQFPSAQGTINVEDLTQFRHPWGMDFLTSSQMLISERGGRLWIYDIETDQKKIVDNAPQVQAGGQGGLLDVALHPDFANNGWVYFTLARSLDGGSGTAVVRAKLSGQDEGEPKLTDQQDLFQVKPTRGTYHFGSRLAFAPNGKLFITFGDHGERPRAQDVTNASGSVVRLNDDGSIPTDNPSFSDGNIKAREGLWSIGHRNQQGADIHPETGELWTVEHGARGGDEINRPEAGKNYGWPIISYGRHYSGGKIGEGTKKDGMEQPIYYWDPSIAPSGLAFYSGNLFPDWKNNLFVGALKDQKLVRLVLDGDSVRDEEILLEGAYGRIRDVRSGPNGALWLLTDSPRGKLLRITPASN